jgi:hypothetical protein
LRGPESPAAPSPRIWIFLQFSGIELAAWTAQWIAIQE